MFRVENIKTKEIIYITEENLRQLFRNEEYTEKDFIITKNECFGCNNDKLDQRSHMECDTGCLHDPKFCEICS